MRFNWYITSQKFTIFLLSWFVALCCCLSLGLNNSNSPERDIVVIDTDAGPDDAMAILLLLSHPELVQVVAITTVTGNTGVNNVTLNVLKTLDTADRLDVPVYVGSKYAVLPIREYSDNYYGYDGFGDFIYPRKINRSILQEEHAATYLSDVVRKNPGRITILAIGPLTNIALAAHLNPQFLRDVKNIIVMGGTLEGLGNIGPGLEFNVRKDPEAASFIFSMVPESKITLVTIDSVIRLGFSKKWRMEALGGVKSKEMRFLNQAERIGLEKMELVWSCADPTAAAILLDRSLVRESVKTKLLVEVAGEYGRGIMIHDNTKQVVTVVTGIDKEKLKTMLLTSLAWKGEIGVIPVERVFGSA